MKIPLECPAASYGEGMRIKCSKTGSPCAFQYFKSCKGWWALSPGAKRCLVRKEKTDGKD